jgi:DNA helicase-2/ATP-dependent DNA helicase PcrA
VNTVNLPLDGLNEAQKQAVTALKGPILVLAGAGSGKTRVITHRILALIESGVDPENILAVTFTNKAAKEMRERVHKLLATRAGGTMEGRSTPTVTTFHALGVLILREQHERLGLPRHFVIHDRADSTRAMKEALQNAGYDPKQFEPRKMISMISKAKGAGKTQTEYAERVEGYGQHVASEVWQHYERIMARDKALDFDDLLLKTKRLLTDHPPVLEHYRKRFTHLHIDEYQDTNKIQYEIARLLAGERADICVVGDVDQNIYSWRGADLNNILAFERHFPGAQVILLEENYRSTQTIITASNAIIAKNEKRIPKTVFTKNADGEPIELYAAWSESDEAYHLVARIRELLNEGVTADEIAVLYRANFQSRALEEAFLTATIPYQMLGTKFFERKEVKDALSYLRLALNPESTGDYARIVNEPARGIGKQTVLKILEGKRSELPAASHAKVRIFEDMMEELREATKHLSASEMVKLIVKRSGMEDAYRSEGEEGAERLENLRELVSLALRYDEYEPLVALEHLLEDAALQSDQDELEETRAAVRLMTVHASKGLEFEHVFITGMEEGLFPHERLDTEGVDEEEERRLFYVALTRAKKRVYLSFSSMRTIYGSKRINIPSSFLRDIGDELMVSSNPTESGYEKTIEID